ncbi:inner membrane-spanning protein YciB [Rhodovulum adriaticum]|uniref:Inner membrane-spanning protein YciB n=1 Tax=Rhodovulum adriaticum TaxID=35804 RepID=A0A4R2NWA1_RHOAD|nr:inner membrane-spanning protein YciB [Rhodovulum adriaticum]MBK1636384.1 intracellular septation protein A [Rhodovulum adriaticum]TCP26439.1 intracellular septation protein [Rhodovulum adriaticum]
MAEKRKINPILKSVLELGPIAAFFVAYLQLRDHSFTIGGVEYEGFILVTAGFVPLILLTTGILWALTRHVSKMQIVTAVLVVLFGGLTVWLNDDRFFKMKPTAIYLLFAGVLGIGLMRGRSYLQYVMEEMVPLAQEGWMILTRRLTMFFAGLAVLNEVIWRTMSTDMWVNFKTFGLTIAIFAFFMTQGGLFKRYGIEEDAEN